MIILPDGANDPDNPRMGWRNLATYLNVAASSSAENFPALNMANGTTFLTWKADGTGSQNIDVDLATPAPVDYVGIARHNLGTAGVGYTLQGSNNGTDWTALADAHSPADDGVILHQFEGATVRFVRLALTSGDLPAQIAVLYVGTVLVVQRRLYVGHVPTQMGRESVVSTGVSESGQFLGRVRRRQLVRGKIAVANLDPDWYRENVEPFAQVADVQPFFWAWRPAAYPEEVGYLWAMDDVQPSNQRSNGMMQFDLSFQGIVS